MNLLPWECLCSIRKNYPLLKARQKREILKMLKGRMDFRAGATAVVYRNPYFPLSSLALHKSVLNNNTCTLYESALVSFWKHFKNVKDLSLFCLAGKPKWRHNISLIGKFMKLTVLDNVTMARVCLNLSVTHHQLCGLENGVTGEK